MVYELYDFQKENVDKIVKIIKKNKGVLDASVVGSGKTFVASSVIKILNKKTIIICPLCVVSSWKNFIDEHFNNEEKELIIDVINYDKIKNNKTNYFKEKWLIEDSLIIFDEAHVLKTFNTKVSKLLTSIDINKNYLYCISATIAYNPIHLSNFIQTMKIFTNIFVYFNSFGCIKGYMGKGIVFNGEEKYLKKLHNFLFDNKTNNLGVRITDEKIKDLMPKHIINTLNINLDEQQELIEKLYIDINNFSINNSNSNNNNNESIINDSCDEEMNIIYNMIKNNKINIKKIYNLLNIIDSKKEICDLEKRIRKKQTIELLKINNLFFIDLIEKYNNENYSSVIMLNFNYSIELLKEKLKERNLVFGVIQGCTKSKERDLYIDNFKNDSLRILIINLKAASVGVSLHDLNGTYKRVSLISLSDNLIDVEQALGRINRIGSKTDVLQRFVIIKNTIEEKIFQEYITKRNNMLLILN